MSESDPQAAADIVSRDYVSAREPRCQTCGERAADGPYCSNSFHVPRPTPPVGGSETPRTREDILSLYHNNRVVHEFIDQLCCERNEIVLDEMDALKRELSSALTRAEAAEKVLETVHQQNIILAKHRVAAMERAEAAEARLTTFKEYAAATEYWGLEPSDRKEQRAYLEKIRAAEARVAELERKP